MRVEKNGFPYPFESSVPQHHYPVFPDETDVILCNIIETESQYDINIQFKNTRKSLSE